MARTQGAGVAALLRRPRTPRGDGSQPPSGREREGEATTYSSMAAAAVRAGRYVGSTTRASRAPRAARRPPRATPRAPSRPLAALRVPAHRGYHLRSSRSMSPERVSTVRPSSPGTTRSTTSRRISTSPESDSAWPSCSRPSPAPCPAPSPAWRRTTPPAAVPTRPSRARGARSPGRSRPAGPPRGRLEGARRALAPWRRAQPRKVHHPRPARYEGGVLHGLGQRGGSLESISTTSATGSRPSSASSSPCGDHTTVGRSATSRESTTESRYGRWALPTWS